MNAKHWPQFAIAQRLPLKILCYSDVHLLLCISLMDKNKHTCHAALLPVICIQPVHFMSFQLISLCGYQSGDNFSVTSCRFPSSFLFHRYFPPSQAVLHLSSTFVGYSEINFHLNCMRAGVAPTETILPFYEGVSWILIGATVWLSLPQTHTHLHSNRFLILAWMLNEQHSQAREKKQECKTST